MVARARAWVAENAGKLLAFTLLAVLAGVGIYRVEIVADEAHDSGQRAEQNAVENCETSNEDRELLLVFLRRELTPSDEPDQPPPEPFVVPPGADSALASFIIDQVNPFLEQIGVTEPDDPEMEQQADSILDRAERLFRARDC